MASNELFSGGGVVVTTTKLVDGANYYPLVSIKSVVYFKDKLDVKALIINAAIAIAGLYGIATLSTLGVILGLIAIGIGGFNLKGFKEDITNPEYTVAVTFHRGESVYLKKRDSEWARRLYDVLREAMMD
jgi:hypothetical protein